MAFRKVFSSSLTDKGIRKIFVQTTDGKNISCRKCHSARIIWVGEKRFRCKKCWSFGSLTAGTFLDGNRLSLRFWYELVWNFVLSHSANKTGKLLGKSPKTCWQGYQFIRWILVQKSADDRKKITGTVEVDESFFGGAFKNLRKKTRWEYRRLGLAKKGRGAALRRKPLFILTNLQDMMGWWDWDTSMEAWIMEWRFMLKAACMLTAWRGSGDCQKQTCTPTRESKRKIGYTT